ncbi:MULTISPECIES: acyl carrier protein [Amycolatopsis]|uniref:Acyl carrier protein n=2 Tax=Amycolatopsis TaxID=1813 RepID=A0A7W3VVC1_9PSEU|nr:MULTISPECIES: acyl carrier protein [Amycolatopsis]AEP40923.1 acyl-carrier protein [Amycolatopsis sp. FU40]MBB1153820.1 acyl carrier protein [Amycolatopsis dendrobii]UKD51729.1 acyl carrier protein [Amycolatopsis sp. FU40]
MTTTPNQDLELTSAAIEERILGFLAERTKTSWEPEADLFESGTVSSLFAMELVVFLEGAFDIEIAGPDLKLVNFRTARVMVGLVERLRAEEAEDGRG